MIAKRLQATPTQRWQEANIAIVFGFGYAIDGFTLTYQSLKNLEREPVPEHILQKLIPLKDKKYQGKGEFLTAVRQVIQDEQLVHKHQQLILDQAEALKPDPANIELLRWVLRQPQIRHILVQEGVWVATDELLRSREILDVKTEEGPEEEVKTLKTQDHRTIAMRRIHWHHPQVYVNTFHTLLLAAGRIKSPVEKRKILIVAHDLQLRRVTLTWRQAEKHYADQFTNLEGAIPDLQTRFPGSHSWTQCWTMWRWVYAYWEWLRIPQLFSSSAGLSVQDIQKVQINPQIEIF